MNALANEGIYVLVDLAEPDISIVRDTPTWDVTLLTRYQNVVDAMNKYTNVLGFFAGNEVNNSRNNTFASPFVKAAIRDIKQYIKEKEYRQIPVGYSSNDDSETRDNLAKYFVCDEHKADFYGINMYEWCGYSSYGTSGYRERTKEFESYPVPVFFSEFGCNLVRPRPFTEIGAIYGSRMSQVWSGGLVYMYFEEENNYGVVKLNDEGDIEILDDFRYLEKEFSKVETKGVTRTEYLKTDHKISNIECPPAEIGTDWEASTNLPPTPDLLKCSCLDEVPCLVLPTEDSSAYDYLFDHVCSQVDCTDVMADGRTGKYGIYSDCSTIQKLSLEISKIYFQNDATAIVCPIENNLVYFNSQSLEKQPQKQCKKAFETIKKKLKNEPTNREKESLSNKETNPSDTSKEKNSSASIINKPELVLLVILIILSTFLF